MIEFYSAQTSNGQRVAIMLEECALHYRVHKVDIFAGDGQKPEFLRLNPAGAVPVIVDPDGPGGKRLVLSQSGAILLYLAMKTGRYFPQDPARRALAFQWFMQAMTDVVGASMQLFLMTNLAPEKSPGNVEWLEGRVLRYLRVVDQQLADREFLADELSIADFALYPITVVRRPLIERDGALTHLARWSAAMGRRPAVARAMTAAA
jgi:GST-like protein